MNKLFLFTSALAISASISACASLTTTQQVDQELKNNFAGKTIGMSVTHLQDYGSNKMEYDKSFKTEEEIASDWMYAQSIKGKIVQVPEDSIFGEIPLLFQLDRIKSDEKAVITVSTTAVKEALNQNKVDCLLLYTSATMEAASPSMNLLQFVELGGRMYVAAKGVGTQGNKADTSRTTNPGDSIKRGVVFYTCGDKTLYLGGVEGPKKLNPTSTALQTFVDLATGKTLK